MSVVQPAFTVLTAINYLLARTPLALFAGLSLLLPWSGQATNELATGKGFVFRAWTTEAGLPQNSVNAIVQTPDGYLWLATQGGLARFDGVRFKVFGLADGLPAIIANCLLVDSQHDLWVGTDGGGLSRWRHGQFENFTIHDGLASDTVTALAEDAAGRLWVGTPSGVSVREGNRWIETEAATLERGRIRALLLDRHGTMWISAVQGLFTFADNRLQECAGPPEFPQPSPYCLLEDRAGRLWASIGNGRVLCRREGEWYVYDQTSGLPFAYITCLTEGADGTVWAGSLDAGLYGFRDERFFPVTKTDGLAGDAIRSLLADGEGHLWVGTRTAGLNRMARRKLEVYAAAQGLTNDYVRSVAETPDGSLWIGTYGGGMYRQTAAGFQIWTNIVAAITYPFVNTVLVTRDGSLWSGGAGSLFQWRDETLVAAYTRNQLPWLADQSVTALHQDVHDGLWIGNSAGQLIRYRSGEFHLFGNNAARGAITALAQATDGTLWVGSTAGGLNRLTPESGEIVSFAETTLSRDIRSLHLDAEGVLWIGTGGGGLNRWSRGRMVRFTSQQGLGDDTVSQILEDDTGHLWLGCNRGIFRVHKMELEALAEGHVTFLHPRAYGVGDGMLVQECASGFSPTALRTRLGRLVFPTVRGLVVINPRQQTSALRPPRVLVEEVFVGGQAQTLPAPASPPGAVPKLVVPPGRRDLEFHYTGLSFAAPERIRFRYRLEGLDLDWVEAGSRRVAYYQRIPPGEFVFRVLAANANNVWSETVVTLAVTVQPHFWETRWFLVGLGLLLLSGAGGMARLVERRRYKRRLARLEMQHTVERERLRISRDMHDHLGSMLTQVSQLSDLGQEQVAHPAAARERLTRIGTQARTAVQALDEIVWATNPRNDNLASFAEYASRYADDFFEPTGIRCWQEIPTDLPAWPLPADVRHNVFLALKETLANVVKHAGATEVWLRLRVAEDRAILIEVDDNGRGFTPSALATQAGNGLRNIEARAMEVRGQSQVTSIPGRGTKVRLMFPVPVT
jgi:ligand-binding sensor domain-containing protein/signal transduction histidine kinase